MITKQDDAEVLKCLDNDVYNREGEGWWEEDNPLTFSWELDTRPFCILPRDPDRPAMYRPSRSVCSRHRVWGRLANRRRREAVHDQRLCGDLCKIKAPRPSSFCASRRVPVCRRNGKLDPLGISVIDVPGFNLGEGHYVLAREYTGFEHSRSVPPHQDHLPRAGFFALQPLALRQSF
jgi:hypothetical protein